jgi:predicted DNA-binding transcriptional regulator AlpA
MSDPNQLLRIEGVSKFTTLATSTINLWVAQGKFPKPITLSKTIKVWRFKDITTWTDKHVENQEQSDLIEKTVTELRVVNN